MHATASKASAQGQLAKEFADVVSALLFGLVPAPSRCQTRQLSRQSLGVPLARA